MTFSNRKPNLLCDKGSQPTGSQDLAWQRQFENWHLRTSILLIIKTRESWASKSREMSDTVQTACPALARDSHPSLPPRASPSQLHYFELLGGRCESTGCRALRWLWAWWCDLSCAFCSTPTSFRHRETSWVVTKALGGAGTTHTCTHQPGHSIRLMKSKWRKAVFSKKPAAKCELVYLKEEQDTAMWMNPKDTMLSKIRPPQKDKYYMIPRPWDPWRSQTCRDRKQNGGFQRLEGGGGWGVIV